MKITTCHSNPVFRLILMISAVTVANLAVAQDGLSVKVGEADLYPSVRLDYITNDNAFLTQDNAVESSGIEISPSVEIVAQRRLLSLLFRYDGTYGSFDEGALDFDDHLLGISADAELTSRKRLRGAFNIQKQHEDLGTGFTRGSASSDSEIIDYVTVTASGAFTYGAKNALGNIETGLTVTNRSYQNQAELTDGQDFSKIEPYGQFTYRLSDRARALLEVSIASFNYGNSAQDRSDISLKTGVIFSETGKSGGALRLGATRADQDQSEREDTTELVANISLFYKPVPVSQFTLTVERGFDDVEGGLVAQDSAVVQDKIRLDWAHDWSSRVSSRAFVAREGTARECPNPDIQTVSSGIEIGLGVRRWLELGAGVSSSQRSSDECSDAINPDNFDYDRQKINVFLRATL